MSKDLPHLPLRCRLSSGRNAKLPYYLGALGRRLVPAALCRARLPGLLASIDARPDAAEIHARAAYYCKLGPGEGRLPAGAIAVGAQRRPRSGEVYYYDSHEFLRYFPADFRFHLLPGDGVGHVDAATLAKARPLAPEKLPGNAPWVLLKLNRIRHFIFVRDPFGHAEKAPSAIFRGKVRDAEWTAYKPNREAFFARYHGNPRFDLGDTTRHPAVPEWAAERQSLWQQLRHRYIFALEGNDVASNLKWVMSSNSLAVMPPPTFETWFQEGLLEPHVHYVPIAPDFSDVAEVLDFYDRRPAARERIVRSANAWAARFMDPARERLAALLTLARYFSATGHQAEIACWRGGVPL